jgi:hypothetical protein
MMITDAFMECLRRFKSNGSIYDDEKKSFSDCRRIRTYEGISQRIT